MGTGAFLARFCFGPGRREANAFPSRDGGSRYRLLKIVLRTEVWTRDAPTNYLKVRVHAASNRISFGSCDDYS